MNRPSHILYGSCAMIAVIATSPVSVELPFGLIVQPIAAAPMVVLGSFLPDIDVKNSNIRKTWKKLSIIALIPAIILTLLIMLQISHYIDSAFIDGLSSVALVPIVAVAINTLLAFELKHRTLTHSLYFPLAFFLCMLVPQNIFPNLAIAINSLIFGLLVGTISHLISDSCTMDGIYVAYPIPLKIKLLPKFMRIKTGSNSETMFSAAIVLITLAYLILRMRVNS